MLVKFVLDRLYAASLPKKSSIDRCNPIVKLVVLIEVIIVAILSKNPILLIVLLFYPMAILVTRRDYMLFLESIKAPLPIALIIIGVSAIFVPWSIDGFIYLTTLFLRIIVVASSILVFISSTNPVHVAFILEKLRLPKWLVLSFVLIWRLIPVTLLVSSEAYAVTRLKGDKPWRALLAASAVSLLRAIYTMETLYVYGAGIKEFTLKPILGKSSKFDTGVYIVIGVIILFATISIFYL